MSDRMTKITAYLSETDDLLGLPPGTSYKQLNQESRFQPAALNKGSQAAGIAQIIPTTREALERRFGRTLDPHNDDDALFMHREVMRENMRRWKTADNALRAYNNGWNPSKWDVPETNNYIKVILGSGGAPVPRPDPKAQLVAAQTAFRSGDVVPDMSMFGSEDVRVSNISDLTAQAQARADKSRADWVNPPAPDRVGFSGLLGSALLTENTFGAWADRLSEPTVSREVDTSVSWRTQARVDGLGEFASEFDDVRNRDEYNVVYTRVQSRLKAREVIASYGWQGTAAAITAGTVLDPVFIASLFIAPEVGVGRIASTAGRFAVRGTAEAAATEIPLQFADVTRQRTDGLIAIGGSAIISGVLGKGFDVVNKSLRDRTIAQLNADLAAARTGNEAPAGSVGAAGVTGIEPPIPESASELKQNFGTRAALALATGFRGIGLKTALSDIPIIREYGAKLFTDIWQREGTALDIPNVRAADLVSGVTQNKARLDTANAIDEGYKHLQDGFALKPTDRELIAAQLRSIQVPINSVDEVTPELVESHFKQLVMIAARSDVPHPVSAVHTAAQKVRNIAAQGWDDLVKLGLRSDKVTRNVGIKSLLMNFDKEVILKDPTKFVQELSPYIFENLLVAEAKGFDFPNGLSRLTADDVAVAIKDSIIGQSGRTNSLGAVQTALDDMVRKGIGKFDEEIFVLPDNLLNKYLINDPFTAMLRLTHEVHPQLALKEIIGYTRFDDFWSKEIIPVRQAIESDATYIAGGAEAARKLEHDFDVAKKAFEAGWKRILGRTGDLIESEAGYHAQQLARAGRKAIVTPLLGGQVLSSLPELVATTMTHQLRPVIGAALQGFTQTWKNIGNDAARRVGMAAETVLRNHARRGAAMLGEAMERGDMMNLPSGGWSRVHSVLDTINNTFQKYVGANFFNDWTRGFVGTVSQDRALRCMVESGDDWTSLTKKDKEWLLTRGIGPKQLKLMKDASQGAITLDNGFRTTDPSLWAGLNAGEAARYFDELIYKDVTHTVNSPQVGQLPDYADGEVMKVALGFQSFVFAAFNQTLLPGLQRADAQVFGAMAAMVGLGTIVGITRQKVLGGAAPDKEYTPVELIYMGVDRSGLASLPFLSATVADRLLGSATSYNILPGTTRYRGEGQGLETLGGPLITFAGDVFEFTRALTQQEKEGIDIAKQGTRLLPFANFWGIRPYEAALSALGGQTTYLDRVTDGFQKTFIDLDFYKPMELPE